ncbi:N-acetylmuramoyl-L-alanine amidase [Nonomuraea sp. K274]|uniref:N-acetylmuramoyl-L-alanine amidase n=1 Tax=Nonomuraea cypriaca TaxID=1187855 RepID=A0A931ACL6_9ACTN|nr:N-acetylmuramoyl-L-alanine amidase [Nonomuraea cypriaca]MBF8187585.1 N-acetylmuramoyl-L-alanine amidase [Nonomuraea cypriaca]
MTLARTRLAALATSILAVFLIVAGQPALATAKEPALPAAFAKAAAAHDVPRDLLVALAYAETHLDGHNGEPSGSNGYGVMHLVSNPTNHSLEKAAELTGLSADQLRTDDAANILGGAAVLRAHADGIGLDETARKDVGRWYEAVAKYGNASSPELARLYADAVYENLGLGVNARGVQVKPQEVTADRGEYAETRDLNSRADAGILSTDYGPAAWVPANSGNYRVSSRETSYNIDRVVIHVAQGSYAGTISWFQNPSANVSSHYVIKSSNGAVTQMVRDKDVAWHAGTYNNRSIGIEHEGFVADASWFTDAMYRSSAALVKHLCDKYGIPKTRTGIVGHSEVPGATHTDPGRNWNWTTFMNYVTGGGTTPPTFTTTVDNATAGQFTASANWGTSTYSTQRIGADYRFADPVASSDPAWYSATIPAAGTYRVEVYHPADPGYSSSAPYIVATSSGNQTVYVDQRSGGGAWRSLGTFALNAGTYNVVGVSRWTSGVGLVIADAVRISR